MSEPGAGSPLSPNQRASDSSVGLLRDPTRPWPQIPDHELVHPIGRGAYGEVWLARNLVGTLRAVKVVYRQDFGEIQPFEREFKGMRKFEPVSRSHPGLVNILQMGRNDTDGYFYYVMELADAAPPQTRDQCSVISDQSPVVGSQSGSLTTDHCSLITSYIPRTLRHDLRTRGRMPFEECLQLGLTLTGALEHLHQSGLVHRDIKPSNIIILNGRPKLADIGLVAGVDEARSFVGTEGYIPPEGPGKPQADLYSLGIVLYVMSTGNRHDAFPEPRPDLGSDPDQARWLELNAIIHKACHADPRQRYPSATEMGADLELLQQGRSVRRTQRAAAGWRLARLAGVAVLAVAVLAAALHQWTLWPARRNEPGPGAQTGGVAVFVLPFRSAPGNWASEELASRVTDGLIDSLGIILGKEKVGPRKSAWRLKSEEEARQLAFEQLSPKHAVTGQVSVTNGRVEIAVSAYPSSEALPTWAERVAGSTSNLVALEWGVVERVAGRLMLQIPDPTRAAVLRILSNNVAALELCRRGDEYHSIFSLERKTLAKAAFHEAKKLDPNCTRALAGLLWVNRGMVYYRSHRDSWPEVISLSEDILRIDDTDWYARHWLAWAKVNYEWNWEAGAAELKTFLQEPPDPDYFNLALLERCLGQFEEARIHQALADKQRSEDVAGLFTSVTAKYVDARYAELFEGKRDTGPLYDEVVAGGSRCQQQYPKVSLNWWLEAIGHMGKRDYPAMIQAVQKGRALYDGQELASLAGYAYAKMGDREKAENIIRGMRDQQFPQPYWIARIYAALGDQDKVFEWLDKAVEDRCEWLVKPDYGCGGLWLDEAWDGLRSDPRFQKIKAATGLKWPGEE